MDRLTITQRIKIIKTYYKNGGLATATYRALKENYGLHNRATTQAIGKIVKKFEKTGSRSAENISIVTESFAEDPNISIPRRSQPLGLSYDTLWRILRLDLDLHPYYSQLIIHNVVDTSTGYLKHRRCTAIFGTKFLFT